MKTIIPLIFWLSGCATLVKEMEAADKLKAKALKLMLTDEEMAKLKAVEKQEKGPKKIKKQKKVPKLPKLPKKDCYLIKNPLGTPRGVCEVKS